LRQGPRPRLLTHKFHTIGTSMNLSGATAVVTGAAGGIGRAVAHVLARGGARLAVCDIDGPAVQRVQKELQALDCDAMGFSADIADPEQTRRFANAVAERNGGADILVNCAGVYVSGSALDLSLEDWHWVMSVNLFGVIHACHFFVPPMVARGYGHVCNVVSMYGYWPSPGVAGYLASKFGLFGYSRALREDLRGSGVGVSTVCPGIIKTGLVGTMRIRGAGKDEERVRSELQQFYAKRNYGPDRVAKAIVKGIVRNKPLVLVSPEAKLMYALERYCPRLSRRIARSTARKMFKQQRLDV